MRVVVGRDVGVDFREEWRHRREDEKKMGVGGFDKIAPILWLKCLNYP